MGETEHALIENKSKTEEIDPDEVRKKWFWSGYNSLSNSERKIYDKYFGETQETTISDHGIEELLELQEMQARKDLDKNPANRQRLLNLRNRPVPRLTKEELEKTLPALTQRSMHDTSWKNDEEAQKSYRVLNYKRQHGTI